MSLHVKNRTEQPHFPHLHYFPFKGPQHTNNKPVPQATPDTPELTEAELRFMSEQMGDTDSECKYLNVPSMFFRYLCIRYILTQKVSSLSFYFIIITHQITGHVGMTAGGESDIGSECGMPEEVEAAYQVK